MAQKGQLATPMQSHLGKVPTQGSGPKGVYGGENKGQTNKRQTARHPDITFDEYVKVTTANPLASPMSVQFPLKKGK